MWPSTLNGSAEAASYSPAAILAAQRSSSGASWPLATISWSFVPFHQVKAAGASPDWRLDWM
jgi:hypothetical protein